MSDIHLREASYAELPRIAHILAKAFWEDNLFGQLIHPHRNEYPDDVDLYWLRRARINFWDPRRRWLVATDKDKSSQEIIVGIAQWERLGDGGKKLERWTLDPRKYIERPGSPKGSISSKLSNSRRKHFQAFVLSCHEDSCFRLAQSCK